MIRTVFGSYPPSRLAAHVRHAQPGQTLVPQPLVEMEADHVGVVVQGGARHLSGQVLRRPAPEDLPEREAVVGHRPDISVALRLAQLLQGLGLRLSTHVLALAPAVDKTQIDEAAPAAVIGPVHAAIPGGTPPAGTRRSRQKDRLLWLPKPIYVDRLGCQFGCHLLLKSSTDRQSTP
ncbi:MAG: hypothetical protein ACRDYY_08485 [Acidimicrobiales bacterium]